jgi:tetratricopeptide (TPR) repeat protein
MRYSIRHWERRLIARSLRHALARSRSGEPHRAVWLLRLLAKGAPNHPDVQVLLSRSSFLAGKLEWAREAARAAAATDPLRDPYSAARVARLQLDWGEVQEAKTRLTSAIDRFPTSWRLWHTLGILSSRDSDFRAAINCFRRARDLAPTERIRVIAMFHLAEAFENNSQNEQAVGVYWEIIDREPRATAALFHLVDCQPSLQSSDGLTELILKAVDSSSEEAERQHLHYALGHLYHRSKHYKEAFDHFTKGNDVRAHVVGSEDLDKIRRDVDARIKLYTQPFIDRFARQGSQQAAPIFIVGMPRSGTTLVEQILSSHPSVCGLGERMEIFYAARVLPQILNSRKPYPACVESLTGEAVEQLSRSVADQLYKNAGSCPRVTMKLPENFWELGLIALLFPKAKIIHCQRDPIDTCLSCFMQDFNGIRYATSLEQLSDVYRLYRRIMDHWRAVLPASSLFEIEYEELVKRPDELIPQLCEFCGLTVEEKCFRFYENRKRVDTISRWQVRRPLYQTSLKRWHAYREFLGPLLALEEMPST